MCKKNCLILRFLYVNNKVFSGSKCKLKNYVLYLLIYATSLTLTFWPIGLLSRGGISFMYETG